MPVIPNTLLPASSLKGKFVGDPAASTHWFQEINISERTLTLFMMKLLHFNLSAFKDGLYP